MNDTDKSKWGKVPEATLIFWMIKIAATTLGETVGDAVTMSMNLGYLVGTAIFAAVFLGAVSAQIKAKKFHPVLFWSVIAERVNAFETVVGGILCSVRAGKLEFGELAAR